MWYIWVILGILGVLEIIAMVLYGENKYKEGYLQALDDTVRKDKDDWWIKANPNLLKLKEPELLKPMEKPIEGNLNKRWSVEKDMKAYEVLRNSVGKEKIHVISEEVFWPDNIKK